jgi:hypothetical protein
MYKEFKSLEINSRILKKCNTSILSKALMDEENAMFPVIKRGKGPYLYDYDGNRYVDFSLDRGALNLGHSHAKVTSVLKSWLGRGYGDDPATASLTISHQTLSKKLWETIWASGKTPDIGQWIFIFSTSPLDALLCSIDLMGEGRDITVPYTGTESERRIESCFSRISRLKRAAEPAGMTKGRGETVLFSDETELFFHVSIRRQPELLSRLDGRIIGSWAAAGLPFGCVVMKASLLDKATSIEHILPFAGSLPLYLAKAVVKSIDLRERCGGIAGLLAKHGEFLSALGEKFFELKEGIVFMRESEKILGRYSELRELLLREGILFPVTHVGPLSLSYAHDEELLAKCARHIGLLFDIFYR